MAPRLAQWMMCSSACAGQRTFAQRVMASPSGRKTLSPQTGHRSGIRNSSSSPSRSSGTGLTTCGITSPARSTMTVSPMRMPFSFM